MIDVRTHTLVHETTLRHKYLKYNVTLMKPLWTLETIQIKIINLRDCIMTCTLCSVKYHTQHWAHTNTNSCPCHCTLYWPSLMTVMTMMSGVLVLMLSDLLHKHILFHRCSPTHKQRCCPLRAHDKHRLALSLTSTHCKKVYLSYPRHLH